MKSRQNIFSRKAGVVAVSVMCAILSAGPTAQAAVVGWYRMEGTPDTDIASVTNSNGAADTAIANGQTFQYSNRIVGPKIYDPLTGTAYDNTSSMSFYGGTSSTYLEVADGNPFESADFTVEMFMKIDSVLNTYRFWVAHEDRSVSADGWALRNLPIDAPSTYKPSGLVVNGSFADQNDPQAINDGKWHHFAFVVKTSGDDSSNFGKVYLDYQLVGEYANPNLDNYNPDINASFRIYAEEYLGNVDEVRFTSDILSPDQFLVAIPEPGSAVLILMGTAFLAGVRTRVQMMGRVSPS